MIRTRCWLVMVMGGLVACSVGSYSGDTAGGPGGPPGSGLGDAGPIATPTDLPCDVANFLAADCLVCHGPVPKNGAPNRLDTLAALQAPAYSQPSKSNGALALERIQSASSPMPPAPYSRATSAQISAYASWINAGMPAGSCSAPTTDAGTPPIPDGGLPPTDGGVSNDLPCGIAQTLGTYCTGCHGSPPTNNAPISLDSLATLRAASPAYPGQTAGQRAVARMTSASSPMPPAPYAGVPAAALNEFSAWVSSSMPAGSCTTPVDGGPPPLGDGGVDAGPSDAGVAGDLPCDVADVLTSSCTSCHGSPPSGGAPMSLTSLAQLRASSPSNAAVTNGQACVQRMASTTAQMPPPPGAPVAAPKQSTFASWVSAGMQAGSCGVDAGTPDPAFSGPPTCSSGAYWTSGNGSTMRPGEACMNCHRFAIAGTAYPTGHEYDDCYGRSSQGATVTVTDKNNVSRTFSVNSSGNFSGSASGGWPAFPITAKITFGGKTRVMSGAVSNGNCNSCHTLNGANGAPGRIALP
jgi:mono/diheme cytochrome c family protein